ncbi:hypothetical protein BKA70DRAFT_1265407 [Coprinopsis sp. MPI-PUGE-AT-0042]|nr:hypothetical protein BKA70DRAFT_1265407 [Coprinopsis sp. MPI-PUGE-AT-0042]
MPKRGAKAQTGAKPLPGARKDRKTEARVATSPSKGFFSQFHVGILWVGLLGGLVGGWWYSTMGANQDASSVIPVPDRSVFDPNVESPWHVVDLPGKGKGAIAARDIQQGELLLREKPLLLVPSSIRVSPTDFIWDQVKVLSDDKKEAFFNLSYVGFPAGKDPAKDKKELALAIFETNAVAASPHVGLFPRMARLNHGCSSAFNAVYSWRANEGVLVIHALKPIARGSEVLASYTDTKKPRDERRAYLGQQYKFHCTCESCSLPEAESKASDARLQAMARHQHELSRWGRKEVSGEDAIEHVRAIWKLGDEEGYWSERGRLAGDAAWVAAAHGE